MKFGGVSPRLVQHSGVSPVHFMKHLTPAFCAALISGAACLPSAFAAYQGVKGSVTLTLTATSERGGYFAKDDKTEIHPAAGVTVSFDEDSILNPPGFDPESAGGNYYTRKTTTKEKDYGTTDEEGEHIEDIHPTSITYEESTALSTQTLANATFIKELAARDYVPDSASSGFRLVAIFPAERPDASTPPALFFIENVAGTAIHYVGRQSSGFGVPEESEAGYKPTAKDALMLSISGGVESYTYKSQTTYTHRKVVTDPEVGPEWQFDDEGQTTVSDNFSGKSQAYVDVFPEYTPPGSETAVSTGYSFYYGGLLSYAGRLETFKDQDTSNDLYITTSASLPAVGSAGSFYGDYDDDLGYYQTSGNVTGGFSLTMTKPVNDITAYIDAIPEELAWLKQAILDSYSTSAE